MAATLQSRKKLKREIDIYGVHQPIIVTFSAEGIEFRIKGTRKTVRASWPAVVEACTTPESAPQFLQGRPLAFLQTQACR